MTSLPQRKRASGLARLAGAIAGVLLAARAAAPEPRELTVPSDRVVVQRGFVPFEGQRRLAACVVGTPAGVHYAYDFDAGALLAVWRGRFADVTDLWVGPAFDQVVRPAEPGRWLSGRPLLAFFPGRLFRLPSGWPDQPDPLYQSLGYELEPDGQPVFLARWEELRLRDRIAPDRASGGLVRRLEFSGRAPPWETWLLLGEAEEFRPLAAGDGWTAHPAGWRIRWPRESPLRPEVRGEGSRRQLAVRLDPAVREQALVFTLGW